MNIDIMGISRLRIGTDGDGITTLVAFYDCPLSCKYCINKDCHRQKDNYNYEKLSERELLDMLLVDDIYFRMSGGGVTFGGGEPLLKSAYIKRFIEMAPKAWKYRMETSLYVPWKAIEPLTDLVDQWIVDIKDMNPEIYKKYTGGDNAKVIRNLRKLYECVGSEKMLIRIPNIKGYNTEEDIMHSVAQLCDFSCDIECFDYDYLDNSL